MSNGKIGNNRIWGGAVVYINFKMWFDSNFIKNKIVLKMLKFDY